MNHQDAERRRRQRKKSVGDHTSNPQCKSVNLSTQMRMAAVFAAMKDVCGKATGNGKYKCDLCGRRSDYVEFTDFGEANKQGDRGTRGQRDEGTEGRDRGTDVRCSLLDRWWRYAYVWPCLDMPEFT
jgi:hypothetical protein